MSMSSFPPPPGILPQPFSYSDVHVALVRKVLEKTRQNKIKWMKGTAAFVGIAPNMRFMFRISSTTWESFVATVGQKEVLKVQNNSVTSLISQLTGSPLDPLLAVTAELYNELSQKETTDVQGAINALDML